MKTAMITGGGSGIGLAVAHALAGEKFCAGLIGRREAMWDEEPSMTAEQVAEAVRWLAVSPPDVTFEKIVIRPML